jgi:hypothetical protein
MTDADEEQGWDRHGDDGREAGRRPARRPADGGSRAPASSRPAHGPARRNHAGGMQAARRAAQQVLHLTGHEPENVVSIAKDEDGWQVGVEVLELHRIPDTTDIMATYHVRLDASGDLVRCERGRRYHRASTEMEQ